MGENLLFTGIWAGQLPVSDITYVRKTGMNVGFSCFFTGLAEDSPPGPQSYSWLQHLHFKIEPFPVTSNQRLYRQSSPGEGSARDWYTSVPSTISCSHLGNRVPYGYEYCSPATRQVLSPVTSRCMLTILHAMQGMHPALLFSTGQSGKSATIQELAMVSTGMLLLVMAACCLSVRD